MNEESQRARATFEEGWQWHRWVHHGATGPVLGFENVLATMRRRREVWQTLPETVRSSVLFWRNVQGDYKSASLLRSSGHRPIFYVWVSDGGDEHEIEAYDSAGILLWAGSTRDRHDEVTDQDMQVQRDKFDEMTRVPGPRGSITGTCRIQLPGGQIVPAFNSHLELSHPCHAGRGAITGGDGRFRFDGIPPGLCKITAGTHIEYPDAGPRIPLYPSINARKTVTAEAGSTIDILLVDR